MAPNWPPVDPNSPGLGPKWRPLGYAMIVLGILGLVAIIIWVIVLLATGGTAPSLTPQPSVSGAPAIPPATFPAPSGSGQLFPSSS